MEGYWYACTEDNLITATRHFGEDRARYAFRKIQLNFNYLTITLLQIDVIQLHG